MDAPADDSVIHNTDSNLTGNEEPRSDNQDEKSEDWSDDGNRKKRKRKKKKNDSLYCWYCDRPFTSEADLIQHQKAKHFKCTVCKKKLASVGGMVIHVFQVHKQTVNKVPNAIPGKDSIKTDILGMAGIPTEEPAAKKRKVDSAPVMQVPAGMPPFGGPPPMGYPPFMGGPPGMPPFFPPGYGMPPPGMMGMPPMGGPGMGMPPMGGPGMPPPGMMGMPPMHGPGMGMPPHMGMPPMGMPPAGPAQPLFPIAGAPSQGYPYPGQQQPAPTEKQEPQFTLIFDDEEFSMEERRAQLDKYTYSAEKIKAQVNKLDQSIESRITSIGGLTNIAFQD